MKSYLILSLCLLLAGCSKPEPEKTNSTQPSEDITTEVITMLNDYHHAINKNGLLAEFEFLDKSDEFFWVPPGYTTQLSYDSVKTIVTQTAESLKDVQFDWDSLRVYPLGTEHASFSGIVMANMTDTTGLVSKVSIIETGVVIKRKGGWRLLNGQSAILP